MAWDRWEESARTVANSRIISVKSESMIKFAQWMEWIRVIAKCHCSRGNNITFSSVISQYTFQISSTIVARRRSKHILHKMTTLTFVYITSKVFVCTRHNVQLKFCASWVIKKSMLIASRHVKQPRFQPEKKFYVSLLPVNSYTQNVLLNLFYGTIWARQINWSHDSKSHSMGNTEKYAVIGFIFDILFRVDTQVFSNDIHVNLMLFKWILIAENC